jgi:hypothetical protein
MLHPVDIMNKLANFDERRRPTAGVQLSFGESGRAILLTASEMGTAFLAQIYNAVILAFLIMPVYSPGIQTLYDAVTRGSAKFMAAESDGALAEYIRIGFSQPGSLFNAIAKQDRFVWCHGKAQDCGRAEQYFLLYPVDSYEE